MAIKSYETFYALACLACLAAGAGCIEQRSPAADDPELMWGGSIPDTAPPDAEAEAEADAAPPDAAPPDAAPPDAAPPDAAPPDAAPPDAAPPDADLPDLPPPIDLPLPEATEEECDGLDNDLDGWIDEGVSNACGGCGEPALGRPCVALSAEMIERPAELDPTRIFSASVGLPPAEAFTLDGAECERRSATLLDPLPDLGAARVQSPRAQLTLTPAASLNGRYAPSGGEAEWAPLALHSPEDIVWFRWGLSAGEGAPLGGGVSLVAPQDLDEVDLSPIVSAFSGRGEGARLRWTPRGLSAAPTHLPAQELTLYVGGSRSLTPMGPSRAISHYQMRLSLSDDGLFELPEALTVAREGSSLWVYLERAERRWVDLGGGDAITARVGTLVEAREASTGGGAAAVVPLSVSEPRVDSDALDVTQGLRARWALVAGAEPVVGLSLSLISQGASGYEVLTCEGIDPARGELLIPAERLPDLSARATMRQLTLRADLRRASPPLPDRGEMSESVSLILQLPAAP